jgi:tRNA A37 threonylcarbamoyladenosine modification protein TsaB
MTKKVFLGIDTSNYTTSFAIVDENGDVYECPVKQSRGSDKAILNMIVK